MFELDSLNIINTISFDLNKFCFLKNAEWLKQILKSISDIYVSSIFTNNLKKYIGIFFRKVNWMT